MATVIARSDARIIALDPGTGDILWDVDMSSQHNYNSPLVAVTAQYVFTANLDMFSGPQDEITALSIEDGSELASARVAPNDIEAIAADGSAVYVVTFDSLIRFDFDGGSYTEAYQVAISDPGFHFSAFAGSYIVRCGTGSNSWILWNAEDGSVIADVDDPEPQGRDLAVTDAEGIYAYVLGGMSRVDFALSEVWVRDDTLPETSASNLLDSLAVDSNYLYAVFTNGFYRVDKSNGDLDLQLSRDYDEVVAAPDGPVFICKVTSFRSTFDVRRLDSDMNEVWSTEINGELRDLLLAQEAGPVLPDPFWTGYEGTREVRRAD